MLNYAVTWTHCKILAQSRTRITMLNYVTSWFSAYPFKFFNLSFLFSI